MANKYESLLTKVGKLYFTNISFSTSNFHGICKVHKSTQINEVIQKQKSEYIKIHEPHDLTLRPKAGGPNCSTRSLNQFIDIIFKPFLIHIKSYVKYNLDFLRKCS